MKRTEGGSAKAPTKLTITKEFVAKCTATGVRQVFRDDKAIGLLLRVNADGSRVWYFDYRDPNGKRQSYKIGDADRIDPGEARKRLKVLGDDPAAIRREQRVKAVRAEVEAGKAAARTIRAFLEEKEGAYWNKHLKLARSGLATKKRILSAWKPLVDTDMSTLDVQDAIDHRAERLDDGIKAQTLNRDRIALLALLNQAHTWKLIDKNPLFDPAFKPLKAEDEKRVRYLGMRDEHEEVTDSAGKKLCERQRFMDALAHEETPDYLRQIVTLAMNTGLRRGELFKLRWTSISLQNGTLTVSAGSAKSAKVRHVALNATVMATLEQMAKVKHISGLVFTNAETGKQFISLKKSWKALVTRANILDFTFHDTRHDFASRLAQAGVNLYEIKDLLGHSSITLTERYAHLAPHQKRAAVAMLDAAA